MFATKHAVLAAALLALAATPALAESEGSGDPFPVTGRAQAFALSAPRLDLGAESYPAMASTGAGWTGGVNHVTRERVAAYQLGVDVGSEAYPAAR